ncbi:MAG: acetoacetate--CoA ligase, partial [Deltaproteobacteria bacterium]|nr:acetoacetate--CoA ligase [Deltaproteobacteria bacterium]
MKEPLWKPSAERIKNANMTKFMAFVNKRYNKQFTTYFELYDWSVANITDLWAAVWDFLEIKASKKYERVVDDLGKFPGAQWFVGAEMNFAENLLRYRDDKTAFVFKCETKPSVSITYKELYRTVARLAGVLRTEGVTREDRVVAYMPNMSETAVAMLAATSVGATWASCGSELGVQAVIDRFSQIAPKVLFVVDGYLYKNKPFHMLSDVRTVVEAVPSIERVVIVPYVSEKPDISVVPKAVLYTDLLSRGTEGEILFEQVPANHPVYIMFSSG